MKFINNVPKERYEEFVKNNPKSHFLQSYAWGQFSKEARGLTPHYVALEDNSNNIVAATLLLEKKLPLGYSYFYAPRGFILNFNDEKLILTFTNKIKDYVKKYNAIFVKIDPDLIVRKTDNDYNEIPLETDYNLYLAYLKKAGFKHLGFTKNFETSQPRYTFRIDLNRPFEDIEDKISKSTKQRIHKAKQLGTNFKIGTSEDLPDFYNLMLITESKKDFISYPLSYYQNLFKIYNQDNKINLFIGSINVKETLQKFNNQKDGLLIKLETFEKSENKTKSINNQIKEITKTLDRLNNDISEYEKIMNSLSSDELILNGHVIIEYANKAWVLYAGNHTLLTNSNSNYNVYYEHLKYCYDHGIKMYDQFGTIGDISKENPLYGLHEFKKKFGGDYIEFIGEFDLVTNKLMYFLFMRLVPKYRNIIKKLRKIKK